MLKVLFGGSPACAAKALELILKDSAMSNSVPEEEYKIVGSAESDIAQNKLSNESPVGRGLIGAKVGQVVTIPIPDGEVQYEILDIRR